MAKEKIADYLFGRIKDLGVAWTFGIPGDFVLPLYAAQARSSLKTVVMNHEPSVGFAADAYARVQGFGVALVTYGAGGLNMVNPTALAYAEESPLLVLSGAPETRFRRQKPQLHHCVKSFDTQFNVYREVTESQALIDNPAHSQSSIDRVLQSVQLSSRPGYIEISRDMVNTEIEVIRAVAENFQPELPQVHALIHEIIERISQAKLPVLFAGAQIRRFNLLPKIIAIAEALNLPVVTSILGKASFPESHPNFIGTYFGRFGEASVREYVESSDCIVGIGIVLTEMETGGYTADLPADKLVLINCQEMTVGHHHYLDVDLPALVDQLFISIAGGAAQGRKSSIPSMGLPMGLPMALPTMAMPNFDENKQEESLTVGAMLDQLNKFIDERFAIVSDVGDCLYAGLSLKTDTFIAPGYYSSMGFGVPAGIGAQLANPALRSLVLVGDGGFQMTGTEISTAAKLGINPIIVLFDNSSYAMLRFIDQERDYYNLAKWDYCQVAKGLGAQALRAETKGEFATALKTAAKSDLPFLIDAVLSETDISPTLKRLTDHFGARVRASIS